MVRDTNRERLVLKSNRNRKAVENTRHKLYSTIWKECGQQRSQRCTSGIQHGLSGRMEEDAKLWDTNHTWSSDRRETHVV